MMVVIFVAIFFESNSKYSEFYVCAILNSRACQYYHLKNTKLKRDGYYEYFEGQLSTLPIRYINFTTSQEQRTFYQNKAQKLYQQLTLNRDEQEILYFVDHHLEQQPEASDVIHDLLTYLAECMLNLNKEKRKLQNSFLKFLEAKLEIQPQPDLKSGKVGLEALTKGKGQLLNYPRDYQKGEKVLPFDAVENILLENRRHFRQYLDSRLLREIEEEYTENVTAIEKLKQQLKLTDDLIDKIVYKLYGLTEEEIGVIEEEK
jgi:hypothetical protein